MVYAEHEWFPLGALSGQQLGEIKDGIFKLTNTGIFFEKISFLTDCRFQGNDIAVTKLFDQSNIWESSWYGESERFLLRPRDVGPLIYRYSKQELDEMKKIQLLERCSLSFFYFNQDTLIVPNLGGVVIYLTKTGKGN